MPTIFSKIELSSAASSSNVVLADVELIKGASYSVPDTASLDSINSNYLTDGQVIFVDSEAVFYKLTITPANPPISFTPSYDWAEVVLGAGSAISSSQQISDLGFINSDVTSSMSVATASYIDPTFISASAAASGFGAGGGSGDITSVIAGNGLSGGSVTGDATLTLDTSSQHFIDAVNALAGDSGIFTQTGSVYSTTNNLEVTGSFTVADGLLKLKEFTTTPTAQPGAIYYSASAFYFGVD